MSFKGDLSTIGLSEVFQMISMAGKEGTLIVQDADSRKCIYFGGQGVQLVSTGRRKGLKIGELLVRAGILSEHRLREVLDGQRSSKKLLGETLVESGLVTEDEIQRLVRSQIEEEIYDLFLWKSASFEFVEGPPPAELRDPDSPVTRLSFDVNALLLEAVRRADEWNVINSKLASLDCVFLLQGEPEGNPTWTSKRVLGALNGTNSVRDIVAASGATKYEVCKMLVELLDQGKIRALPSEEILGRARQEGGEGRLKLIQAAQALAPKDPEPAMELARYYESEGKDSEAAAAYLRVGSILAERGRDTEARVYFLRSRELNPENGHTHPPALAVEVGATEHVSHELIEKELARRELGKARAHCEEMLRRDPNDLDCRVHLVRIFKETGERREMEVQLRHLHQNLPADPAAAERLLNRIKETGAYAASTTRPRWQSRPGMRARIVGIAALFLVLVLGGGAVKFEMDARKKFAQCSILADRRMSDKDYAGALQVLEEFKRSAYRFSPFVAPRVAEKEASVRSSWDLDARTAGTRTEVRREKLMDDLRRRHVLVQKYYDEGDYARAQRGVEDLLALARRERDQDYVRTDAGAVRRVEEFIKQAKATEDKVLAVVDRVRGRKREADTLVKDGKFREAAAIYDELIREYKRFVIAEDIEFPIRVRVRPAGVKVTDTNRKEWGIATDGALTVRVRHKESVQLRFSLPGYRDKGPIRVGYLDGETPEIVMDEKACLSSWAPFEKPVEWTPVSAGGLVFVANGQTLYGIAGGKTAILKWQLTHARPISGAPVEREGRIFYGSGERALHIVDPSRQKDSRIVIGKEVVGSPGVSADGRYVAVGTVDRFLTYLDLQAPAGKEVVWERRMAAVLRGGPAVRDGVVYFSDVEGKLRAVKGDKEGDLLWTYSAPCALTPPTLLGDRLYVGRADSKVVALDLQGNEVWAEETKGPVEAPPAVVEGTVYATTLDGILHVFPVAGERWSWQAGRPIRASAAVGAGRILVAAEDRLHALDATTGKFLWSFAPAAEGARFLSAPLLVGNVAYCGATDKTLYAVSLE